MNLSARRRGLMGKESGGGTVHGTWEDLFRAIDAGTYSTEYAVGDTIPLDLGTEGIINMEIVKFNADVDENNSAVPVSMIGVELLTTSHRFNPAQNGDTEGTGNIGGWPKSELRTFMNGTIYDLIPATVKSRIKTVKKYSQGHTDSATNEKNLLSTDKIWCPGMHEITTSSGWESSGSNYSNDATWRKKHKVGSDTNIQWWSRSGYKDNAAQCSAPTSGGSVSSGNIKNTQNSYGIAIGFCIG